MRSVPDRPDIVNLVEAYSESGKTGPLWGCDTGDLNGTYLVLKAGDATANHVNSAVDVIMVVLSGEAKMTVNGATHDLAVGYVVVLRKGDERAWEVTKGPFSYLNVHRRRILMPGDPSDRPMTSS